MGEPLDEKNSLEDPIWVSALYYFQLFDYEQELSQQRQVQLIQDDPAQYFFHFPAEASSGFKEEGWFGK